jgi:hypothetical protein
LIVVLMMTAIVGSVVVADFFALIVRMLCVSTFPPHLHQQHLHRVFPQKITSKLI